MKIGSTLLKRYSSLLLLLILSFSVKAQYFGQNKVRYKKLDFKVLQTPHFEIYYYIKNEKLLKRFSQDAETWYKMHQEVFRDTFLKKNPIILYNNHPDFQQTTVLNGEIGIGTGGVTEALKNRVIMPVMELNSQTRHVLGHELVHAFQYHLLLEKDSISLENVGQTPLWMVEGMAEYLSIGKKDAFTSMWMRDAMLNRDIPSLKDLTNSNKYFPYRYGQAFWTYIGSQYGDTTIVPLFKNTAKYGYENAIRYTFGYDDKTLSGLWKNSIDAHYKPMLKADSSQIKITGTKIIDNKNAGNMNVAPALSPDGKYLAFMSEKDLFGIDLFLADAKTGQIIRKLSSQISNGHIDDFNFIESAGAWSPDSKQFAFSIFSHGRNQMMIINVANGTTVSQTPMDQVQQFGNLTWSPNGKDVAFSGMVEGQSDIFSYNLDTKVVTQITNDVYSDYAPSYSPDGKKLVFSSDRAAIQANVVNAVLPINLAVYDIATKAVNNLDVFPGANNLNAQFSANSQNIYFLSNRDGFRNLYKYNFSDNTVDQLTDYFTGISGITEFSPAISVSTTDDIVYSYYRYQRYTLYNAKLSSFKTKRIGNQEENFDAAILPPMENIGVNIINSNLNNFDRFEKIVADSMRTVPYKPKFRLDYLANSGVGVSTSRFGTGVSGGIVGMFSDILGTNQIIANLSVNGEIYDFGGLVGYINQKSRINWGAAISHIPYVSGFRSYGYENITVGKDQAGNDQKLNVLSDRTDIIRTFEDQIQVFGAYPFSKIHRFELGGAFSHYSYRIDRYSNYYDDAGFYRGSDKSRISNDVASQDYGIPFNSFTLYQLNAGFVGDNSIFGLTGPLDGFRYRVSGEKYFGTYNFAGVTADLRKYWRAKPVTFAVRSYNTLRIGKDADRLYPMYVGYPYLIRGYESNSIYKSTSAQSSESFDINQLTGSKIAVFNFEVRLPFTGPKKLAAIPSKFLFSDLNLFFDAGLAWTNDTKVKFKSEPTYTTESLLDNNGVPVKDDNGNPVTYQATTERVPAMSVGISVRVNVFGYFVLEPYYAIPFQRKDVKTGVFGLTFAPGW